MRSITFPDAPGWIFEVQELSNSVYSVQGQDEQGRSVGVIGTDADELLERCRQDAKEIVKRVASRP